MIKRAMSTLRQMASKGITALLLALVLLPCTAIADSILTGSKPYTFIPGTIISSSQVNADFDYIINGVNTNAAKNGVNSSITALTGLTTPLPIASGGSPIYRGTTIGGTANAITITATVPDVSSFSLSTGSWVVFKPTSNNTGATTLNVNSTGAASIKKREGFNYVDVEAGDVPNGEWVFVLYDGVNYVYMNFFTSRNPTVQRFTSGSGTYTPVSGTTRIRVRMVGGGGGGSAIVTNNGAAGGNSTFESWVATGGSGGVVAAAGGGGGSGGASGTGILVNRANGQGGSQGLNITGQGGGGLGGMSVIGNGGRILTGNTTGGNASSHGGGGAGATNAATNAAGSGGGGGEYVEFFMNSPSAVSYAVGAGGNGGAAGTQAGGNGNAGLIIVEEYYD